MNIKSVLKKNDRLRRIVKKQHKLDGSILRKRMIDSKNPLDAIKLYLAQ